MGSRPPYSTGGRLHEAAAANSPRVTRAFRGRRHKYIVSGFSRTASGPPDQPPLKLRRSAEALAKAEGGHYVHAKMAPTVGLPAPPARRSILSGPWLGAAPPQAG